MMSGSIPRLRAAMTKNTLGETYSLRVGTRNLGESGCTSAGT